MSKLNRLASSFRDPNGFLFSRDGVVYRQINQSYSENYQQLFDSGLYAALTEQGLLLPHQEAELLSPASDQAYLVICPEQLEFISYPYEWSFSQLQDAALVTLAIQKKALEYGMSLKDCSAYNIQFVHGKPKLIDTLSFELYPEGSPWVAYRQFCQHFLAPLALMMYCHIGLIQLMRSYIDGIPLDLVSALLPKRTRINLGLALHIHLHSSAQMRFSDKAVDKSTIRRKMTKTQMLGLIDSLENLVRKMKLKSNRTEWADYYQKLVRSITNGSIWVSPRFLH